MYSLESVTARMCSDLKPVKEYVTIRRRSVGIFCRYLPTYAAVHWMNIFFVCNFVFGIGRELCTAWKLVCFGIVCLVFIKLDSTEERARLKILQKSVLPFVRWYTKNMYWCVKCKM